ncbi:DUF5681 domain-containing protein [Parasphingopyxis marina]|uniref:DUF5681 domain-containing protein n=1 Tax=Parasphingopyxis marina TaxID=2761622 RepID=A0A842HXE0_9SPHN|nr:DUF5681 domain-containing protein [Parasphingopyxis marina]MBC2776610.1 hypothetical protein [Parasphingopyxis marina]
MSEESKRVNGRFAKGHSGNPNGRPQKAAERASAFDVIVDKTLTITQGGKPREVTVDEALQHRTYQDAIAGGRMARRTILKMIAKREKAAAASRPKRNNPVEVLIEAVDPRNADEAMIILGIVDRDPRWDEPDDAHLLLEPWAVNAALARRAVRELTDRQREDIRRCTRDAKTLKWPARLEA